MQFEQNIITKQNNLQHVAVIMDGNGRWAKLNGVDKVEGHTRGVDSLRRTVIAARDAGVRYLTVYAFSTENWGRPQREVSALMQLFAAVTVKEAKALAQKSIRLSFIGDFGQLAAELNDQINEARSIEIPEIEMTLTVAMNYSARWDIVNAAKLASEMVAKAEANELSEELFQSQLSTSDLPDVDLMIRTSNEQRLSNFMLWESSYAELYFTETLWPDFSEEDFQKAVNWFNGRKRRFGVREDENE